MSPTLQRAIEQSRRAILDEIADAQDVVFIRGLGNAGDELIWEGTRALLSERIYREVPFDAVCSVSGEVALLTGGGGLCRPYHEWMTRALAIAALRFERVVLLPSSFDPSEDAVREALISTPATVFAREAESYRRIRSLCDARLAHDCAFYFDFAPHIRAGQGQLTAFRTDAEVRAERAELPAENDDISLSAPSLGRWLDIIARHELVRTDRAHVMIAAAMMGKRVEYSPSSYHKLDAIAAFALSDLPVRRMASPDDGRHPGPATGHGNGNRPRRHPERVTAVLATRERAENALRAVDSLAANRTPVRAVIVDNNSAPPAETALRLACAVRDDVALRRSDRDLGVAGAHRLGVEDGDAEFVLLLDDEVELEPGALDALVEDLDAHPGAGGVSATVLLRDGAVHHSGGWMRVSRDTAEFGLIGVGEAAAELELTGAADWVPATAALLRRALLEEFPLDPRMRNYGVDREWCYRVERARPGSFRRSLEARALLHGAPVVLHGREFAARSLAVRRLQAHAAFYARHGRLMLRDLFDLVPELAPAREQDDAGVGAEQVAAARLLLELLCARGGDWLLMEWMNGGLDPLLASGARLAGAQDEAGALRERLDGILQNEFVEMAELRLSHETLLRIYGGGWWRLRSRLAPALRVYQSLKLRRRG